MDDAADLIRAIAALLWPAVVVVAVFLLLPALRTRIRSGDISVKFGQLEVSVQDASDNLRKQVKDLQDAVAALTANAPKRRSARAAVGTREPYGVRAVLWVTTDPSRHAYEVATLQEDGISVELADRATARSLLTPGRFDAVVTDADEAVVREVCGSDPELQVIVYAADAAAVRAERLLGSGASSVTSSPLELFRQLKSVER